MQLGSGRDDGSGISRNRVLPTQSTVGLSVCPFIPKTLSVGRDRMVSVLGAILVKRIASAALTPPTSSLSRPPPGVVS